MTEECEVYIDGEYGDIAPEFFNTALVKARCEHECRECHRAILKGVTYERTVGKWDGDLDTIRTCLVCVEIRTALAEGGFIYGLLWDELDSQLAEIPSPKHCISKLKTPDAKAYFSERWLKARTE